MNAALFLLLFRSAASSAAAGVAGVGLEAKALDSRLQERASRKLLHGKLSNHRLHVAVIGERR